jgi:hydroxyatrazine ethylaminohydrolase
MAYLLKNCAAIVPSATAPILCGQDMLISGKQIAAIGPNLSAGPLPKGCEIIDAEGWFIYPGLVNTHHHFFQCFVRNRADLDWTKLSLIEWLDRIYPIFSRLTEDAFYNATIVALAELIKHGCTTAFDHQYCFPRHAGSRIVDRQFEAAEMFGIRLHAGRGGNTLPKSEGSTIPDEMLESTDGFLADCERLIDTYHDASPFSMRQVAIAPCQPVNCYKETFIESVRLARDKGVLLHTHVGEGESAVMQARTGVSHCPEPVYLVGAEVTDIPAMHALGLRIGLGADGAASNDNSNLMHCIHSAYMLQCLVAAQRSHPVPDPAAFLGYATTGGADLLRRADLGKLAPGMAADLFAIDTRRLDYVGTRHDPASLIPKVGIGTTVDLTMINGRIVWRNGAFPHLDERALFAQAEASLHRILT